ncbi:MCP four helix bundle domain-containing protein, partial [Pseudorhizobium flavum]
MTRPKVKTALAGILILIGISFGLFAAFALNRLGAINAHLEEIATDNMPTAITVKDMEVQLGDIRTAYRSHILRSDAEGKAAAVKTVETATAKLKEDIAKFNTLNPSKEESEIVGKLGHAVDEYNRVGATVFASSLVGHIDEANRILRDEMVKSATEATESATRLVEISNSDTTEAYANAQSAYSTTLTVSFIAIGVLATVIAAAIWFAITGIARPIQTITGSMNNLARGDADTAIPFAGRTDEIGEMAAAVEVFRTNALENRRLEQEA